MIEYKIGDYIILKDFYYRKPRSLGSTGSTCPISPYGLIINKYCSEIYNIEFFYQDEKGVSSAWLYSHYIERKMTEQEIENLKLMLKVDKYNL